MSKTCTTHHHACDCREEYFAKLETQLQTQIEATTRYHKRAEFLQGHYDKLEAWAKEAAQAIEAWALEESMDLTRQMSGCRALLETCPVNFDSSNTEDRHVAKPTQKGTENL